MFRPTPGGPEPLVLRCGYLRATAGKEDALPWFHFSTAVVRRRPVVVSFDLQGIPLPIRLRDQNAVIPYEGKIRLVVAAGLPSLLLFS
jgi:hypothetical protein